MAKGTNFQLSTGMTEISGIHRGPGTDPVVGGAGKGIHHHHHHHHHITWRKRMQAQGPLYPSPRNQTEIVDCIYSE